jgi:hypothetical protein
MKPIKVNIDIVGALFWFKTEIQEREQDILIAEITLPEN